MYFLGLFGGATIEGESGSLPGIAGQPRRMALLALLATAPKNRVSRDKLIAHLWPDRNADQARHLLSESLYVLRKALGAEALLSEGDNIRLVRERVLSDVGEFEAALRRGDVEGAVALYSGPFLDGFFVRSAPGFEGWVELQRARLAEQYAAALESLAMDDAEAAEEWAAAAGWWKRLAAHDPYNSRYALRLMETMAAGDDPANALQHAREHEQRLREELGVEPHVDLVAFAQRLQEGPKVHEVPALGVAAAEGQAEEAAQVDAPRHEARRGHRFRTWQQAVGTFVVALAVWGVVMAGWRVFGARGPGSWEESKSIAVLPFENLSGEEATQPFVDGIHEDILTHLYKIADLKPVSRASVMEYKQTTKNLRQIADELNVAAVLGGAVQRAGTRVRINVQLIDAKTDRHLWAEVYERDLTAEDLFEIQTDIAERVASALKAQLTPEEGKRIAAKPTTNLEAYEAYLTAREYARRNREEEAAIVVQSYERAIALDPNFAQAYAETRPGATLACSAWRTSPACRMATCTRSAPWRRVTGGFPPG